MFITWIKLIKYNCNLFTKTLDKVFLSQLPVLLKTKLNKIKQKLKYTVQKTYKMPTFILNITADKDS